MYKTTPIPIPIDQDVHHSTLIGKIHENLCRDPNISHSSEIYATQARFEGFAVQQKFLLSSIYRTGHVQANMTISTDRSFEFCYDDERFGDLNPSSAYIRHITVTGDGPEFQPMVETVYDTIKWHILDINGGDWKLDRWLDMVENESTEQMDLVKRLRGDNTST